MQNRRENPCAVGESVHQGRQLTCGRGKQVQIMKENPHTCGRREQVQIRLGKTSDIHAVGASECNLERTHV